MKCPGCGCNFMDDEKFCPMCEMRNNAFARAVQKRNRKKHESVVSDCSTTTCAHPSETISRPAKWNAPKNRRPLPASSALRTVIGIIIALYFAVPLLLGFLNALLGGLF